MKFEPKAGDEVVCRGYVGVYEKQGRMQLYVSSMKPVGAGAAQRALEELKKKLQAEGLFAPERKRDLPFMPRTIGVVTSRSGAALHDILTTLRRRFPPCHVLVSHAAVQGADAPAQLIRALDLIEQDARAEVVLLGRGGGAAEDLAAFNDEGLVRRVASFPVPVISAVGHEVDYSLCDLVADYRAATPTAAAEAAVPVHAELLEEVKSLEQRLRAGARRYAQNLRHRLAAAAGRLRHPALLIAEARQRVDELGARLERGLREHYWREASRFKEACSKLSALSPLEVLERGYSLTSTLDGRLVRSSAEVRPGQTLDIRFRRGGARVEVASKLEDEK
jgi:exodeoxyribonuclease VII large subunit